MAKRGDLKWGSPEKLQTTIDSYFAECKETGEAPNIAGLCIALDIHRDTYNYYAGGRYESRLAITAREQKQDLIEAHGEDAVQDQTTEDDIYKDRLPAYYTDDHIDSIKARVSDILKKAKTRMESYWWSFGTTSKNFPMAIFALKAVHGYTDQPQETHLTKNKLQLNIKIDQPTSNATIITVSED